MVDPRFAADLLGARTIPVPAAAVRAASELDWQPVRDAAATVTELLAGLREGAGADTSPLAPDRHRLHEISTGVGRKP